MWKLVREMKLIMALRNRKKAAKNSSRELGGQSDYEMTLD